MEKWIIGLSGFWIISPWARLETTQGLPSIPLSLRLSYMDNAPTSPDPLEAPRRHYGRRTVMTTQRLPAPLVEAVRRKAGATPWTTVVERLLTAWTARKAGE